MDKVQDTCGEEPYLRREVKNPGPPSCGRPFFEHITKTDVRAKYEIKSQDISDNSGGCPYGTRSL